MAISLARIALVAAESGDPRLLSDQRLLIRRNFANLAAEVGINLPQLRPVQGGLLSDGHVCLEPNGLDAVTTPNLVLEAMRLREQEVPCPRKKTETSG